jgi:hypothetical protein
MADVNKKFIVEEKKGKILENLLVDKVFKEEGVIIRKWEGEANTKDFISEIKKDNIHFIGVLDSNLVKQGYGYMCLPNNEKYFGIYTDDLRSKHGLYQYPDKIVGDKIEREFFFGIFNKGKISERGVYLWIKENKDVPMFNNFEEADFSCFVGDLEETHFIEGTYLTKKGEEYYVYHGKFNNNNEKDGDNAFYYNSDKDELLFGKIEKNKFVNSFLSVFDEDGNIKNGIYANFNKNGKILDYKQREEMPDKSEVFDEMFDFRNKILDKDYFGEIFETFKSTLEFVEKELNIDSFDSKEKFPKLINISFNFNKISIKEDIESVLSKYH